MTFRLRAVRALVLLAGFHLLGVALLAGMAVLDRLLVTRLLSERAAWVEGEIITVTVLLAAGILRGMVVFVRAGRLRPEPNAVAVTPEEQPELWAQVRAAAEATGERAPEELHLTDAVNAGVAEHSRLLGLLPGRRRMVLGLPLLAGLTVPQLRAVLAHEFGHFGHRDTRLGGATMRGRVAVLHTVAVLQGGSTRYQHALGAVYGRYARMFLRASQAVARHQELAADRVAARHAGRDATLDALRTVPVLGVAYTHYLATYATLGRPCGALPPVGEVHGGFRRLLAARTGDQLTALAAGKRPPRPHPYDSHPPTAERIALLEQLPADGDGDGAGGGQGDGLGARSSDGPGVGPEAAITLLRDADRMFAELEARTLPPETAGLRRLAWEDLVVARSAADAEGWSRPLRLAVARAQRAVAPNAEGTVPAPREPGAEDRLPGLEEVLDAFDAGLLWMAVADRMPKPPQAARLTGASARNFVRPRIFDGLAGLVHLRLIAAGQVTPVLGWSDVPGLALPDAWEHGMDDALDAATADTPDTAPLRALLAGRAAAPVG